MRYEVMAVRAFPNGRAILYKLQRKWWTFGLLRGWVQQHDQFYEHDRLVDEKEYYVSLVKSLEKQIKAEEDRIDKTFIAGSQSYARYMSDPKIRYKIPLQSPLEYKPFNAKNIDKPKGSRRNNCSPQRLSYAASPEMRQPNQQQQGKGKGNQQQQQQNQGGK